MATFKKEAQGTTLTLAPIGSIDANAAPLMQDELNESMAGIDHVVFDFAELVYISSAGLRVLLATVKSLGKPDAVVVKNASDEIRDLLRVTKLATFMTIE